MSHRGIATSEIKVAVFLFAAALLSGVVQAAQPNLAPTTPTNWSGPIVVSNGTGTNVNSTPVFTTDTLYVDLAFTNNSTVAAGAFTYLLFVDGVNKGTFNSTGLANGATGTTLDVNIGQLSAGSHSVQLQLDSGGAVAESNEADNVLTITVVVQQPVPQITSPLTATGVDGQTFQYQVTATNNPTVFNAGQPTNDLPTGLSIDPATGIISGTPAIVGTFNVTISATNTTGTGSATLVIVINPAPPLINSNLDITAIIGVPFSYHMSATGTAPISFSAAPIPVGLRLGSDTLSGVPNQTGVFFTTITATNAAGTNSKQLKVTVQAPPVINSPFLATAAVGDAFFYRITSAAIPQATTYSVTPNPPLPGLSFDPNTGVISGVPAAGQEGPHLVTISATNTISCPTAPPPYNSPYQTTGSAQLVIAVSAVTGAPAITNLTLQLSATETSPFAFTVTASNIPTSFSATGLPASLSINPQTGQIAGIPAIGEAGTYNVTVTATNAQGSGSALLQLTIGQPVPVFTSPLEVTAFTNIAFSYQLTADYTLGALFAPTTWNLISPAPAPAPASPTLPVRLNFDTSTGVLSGKPISPNDIGTYYVEVQATNALGLTGSAILKITVMNQNTPIVTSPLTAIGIANQPFNYQATATGGGLWSTVGLPPSLTIDQNTGLIEGTPNQSEVGTWPFSLRCGGGPPVTVTLDIYLTPPPPIAPVVNTSPFATGVVGLPFRQDVGLTPANVSTPAFLTAFPLPGGLRVSTNAFFGPQDVGIISGRPTSPGSTQVAITAINAGGADTRIVTINIQGVIITSPLTAVGQVGEQFLPVPPPPYPQMPISYFITATGEPNTFSASGLPSGLSIDVRTGLISGVPVEAGVFPVTITASNPFNTGTATLVITINPPAVGAPVITSVLTASVFSGEPFNYQIVATNMDAGSNPITYEAYNLPSGLVLDPNPASPTGGLIFGSTSQVGTWNVTIVARNATGADAKLLVLTVSARPPTIDRTNLSVTAIVGQPFNYTITATGTPSITFSVTPNPPVPGLTFSINAIQGTPTTAGSYTVSINAANAGGTDQVQLIITVLAPPAITSALTATGVCGSPFTYTITASGSPTITFNASPLPLGLVLSDPNPNDNQATISGTPMQGGLTTQVTLTATNGAGSVQSTLNITINGFTITSNLFAVGTVGQPFTYQIASNGVASGTPPYSVSVNPPAPGLTFNASTGVISGIPTTEGVYVLTITANNSACGSQSAQLTIGISNTPGAPVINSPLLVTGAVGVQVNYQISAINNPTSYNATGLPTGVTINTATGAISGIPQVSGVITSTISATNANGTGTAQLVFAISDVPGGPAITSPIVASGIAGVPFTYQITATNPPLQSYNATNLPTGLTVNTSNGLITGMLDINSAGIYNIQISATNNVGTGIATLILTVSEGLPFISNGQTVTGNVGVPFNYAVTVGGLQPIQISISNPPPGLTIVGNTISGIPTTQGTYTANVVLTNSLGSVTTTLDIVIGQAILATITSPLSVTGIVNQTLSYTITATGSEPISFAVTGLPTGLVQTGNVISGASAVEGSFAATITATNPAGSVSQTLVIIILPLQPNVDSDGDGFPDELEIALGTNALDASSTPFGGLPANAKPYHLDDLRASIKLNFVKTNLDQISLTGSLPIPAGIKAPGQLAAVDIGGVISFGTLDLRGSYTSNDKNMKIKVNATRENLRGINAKYSVKLKGDFKAKLADEQLNNQPASKSPRKVKIMILFANLAFEKDLEAFYTFKNNKGLFK